MLDLKLVFSLIFFHVLGWSSSLSFPQITEASTVKSQIFEEEISSLPELTPNSLEQAIQAYKKGNYQEAASLFQFQLEINRQNTRDTKVLILNYLALTHDKLGQTKLATNNIQSALELGKNENPIIRANLANTAGIIHYNQGNKLKSLEYWQKAKIEYRDNDSQSGYIKTAFNEARVLNDLGFLKKSRDVLLELETLIDTNQDHSSSFYRLLGNNYRQIGKIDLALKNLKLAVEKANTKEEKISTNLDLGLLKEDATLIEDQLEKNHLSSSFRLRLAIAAFNLKVSQESDLDLSELVRVINKESKSGFNNIQQQHYYLSYLNNLIIHPEFNYEKINIVKALRKIAADNTNNASLKAYSLGLQGKIALANNSWLQAQQLTQKAYNLAALNNDSESIYQWQWQLGQIESARKNNKVAISYYQDAVDTLQDIRKNIVGLSVQKKYQFRQSVEPVYRELIQLLIADPTQENLIQARNTVEALKLAELENYFGTACLQAVPENIDRIEKNAAVIYPIILDDKLAVITSIDNELSLATYNISADNLKTTLTEFESHFSISGSEKRRQQIGNLIYNWLIDETRFTNKEIKTIVFVPEGMFGRLPLDALWTGDNYLVTKYKTAIAPGLELLPTTKAASFKNDTLLLGGLSEARQGFVALPGVKDEVNQIASLTNSQPLLNENFTRDRLQNNLENTEANILHLATHGKFSSKPEDTFLLTYEDKINVAELEEFLRVRKETPTLVPIELLILSACETAKGDELAALGLAGVALKSGARSTIATLWEVSDEATPIMMEIIYNGLSEGLDKAEILRQAKLNLINSEKFHHPIYWSPFVLVGNWK